MPEPLIRAFGVIKKAVATINIKHGLDKYIGENIIKAADEVRDVWAQDSIVVAIFIPRF
jgi:fumarate hydratase class II